MGIRDFARKSLTKLIYPSTYSSILMPRTQYNYSRDVNGWQSSPVMACVGWIQRTYPEAPVMVQKRDSDGEWETINDHPLTQLLENPNPYYDGLLLSQAFIADLIISGNAYLLKVRSGAGRVVQLWWTPSTLIEPEFPQDGSVFISHYKYTPGGVPQNIDPLDIVHYRMGIDPDNTRKGRSPLQSLLREIFTDDEAANMTATLLRNMGVPGLLISPEKDASIKAQDADDLKKKIKEKTTGDRRGEPMIFTSATKVQTFGFSPEQMNLKELRRIPEERISAVLGIPAIVAGLGAGLDRSTFANMAEAREMAYESGIIPLQKLIGSQTKHQLLSEYVDESQLINYRVAYDLSEIRVLQDDKNETATRVSQLVAAGVMKVTDAQRATDIPVDDTQDFYLRPFTAMVVRSGEEPDQNISQEITPPAKALKSSDEWSEEQKAAYWKAVDNRRQSFWGVLQERFEPLYESLGKAVAGSVEKGNRDTESVINAQVKDWLPVMRKSLITVIEAFSQEPGKSYNIRRDEEGEYHFNASPERKFDVFSAYAQAWINKHAAEKVRTMLDTQKELVANILKQGVADGLSNAQIAKQIRQFYTDNKSFFAQRVARTETTAAASFGQVSSAKESAFGKKEFITSRDDRVRDSHSAIDGEIVGIDEKFSNGLSAPGIGDNPAETIQCRCALAFHR